MNERRPFLRFIFPVDGLETPAALAQRFEHMCIRWARESATELGDNRSEPVIDIGMTGILEFDGASDSA